MSTKSKWRLRGRGHYPCKCSQRQSSSSLSFYFFVFVCLKTNIIKSGSRHVLTPHTFVNGVGLGTLPLRKWISRRIEPLMMLLRTDNSNVEVIFSFSFYRFPVVDSQSIFLVHRWILKTWHTRCPSAAFAFLLPYRVKMRNLISKHGRRPHPFLIAVQRLSNQVHRHLTAVKNLPEPFWKEPIQRHLCFSAPRSSAIVRFNLLVNLKTSLSL